jgi:hypothetical protein
MSVAPRGLPHPRRRLSPSSLATAIVVVAILAVGGIALAIHVTNAGTAVNGPWQVVSVPGQGFLEAAACPSAGNCWVVGSAGSPIADRAILEHHAKDEWEAVAGPGLGSGWGEELDGISCPASGDCWAVGSAFPVEDGTTAVQALVEHLVAGHWTAAVASGLGAMALTGVACPAPGDCWATGGGGFENGSAIPVLAHYDGHGWSLAQSLPYSSQAYLMGVACPSTTVCWAVGETGERAPTGVFVAQGLIERYAQGAWTTATTLSGFLRLNAVACTGTADCWATGFSVASSPQVQVVAEHGTTFGWTAASIPSGVQLGGDGIACTGGGTCWIAGGTSNQAGTTGYPFVARLAGGAWTVVSTPPAGENGSQLNSVACDPSGTCWAVGYDDNGVTVTPLIDGDA